MHAPSEWGQWALSEQHQHILCQYSLVQVVPTYLRASDPVFAEIWGEWIFSKTWQSCLFLLENEVRPDTVIGWKHSICMVGKYWLWIKVSHLSPQYWKCGWYVAVVMAVVSRQEQPELITCLEKTEYIWVHSNFLRQSPKLNTNGFKSLSSNSHRTVHRL